MYVICKFLLYSNNDFGKEIFIAFYKLYLMFDIFKYIFELFFIKKLTN